MYSSGTTLYLVVAVICCLFSSYVEAQRHGGGGRGGIGPGAPRPNFGGGMGNRRFRRDIQSVEPASEGTYYIDERYRRDVDLLQGDEQSAMNSYFTDGRFRRDVEPDFEAVPLDSDITSERFRRSPQGRHQNVYIKPPTPLRPKISRS